MRDVVWFGEVGKNDGAVVGGKGANLGEMVRAGFPVPPGFIVTAQAYKTFLQKNGLDRKIEQKLQGLNPENTKALNQAAKQIKKTILDSSMSQEEEQAIKQMYGLLSAGKSSSKAETGLRSKPVRHNIPVAVRSSATAEDLPNASFAGEQATFLNVEGAADVVAATKKAWASLFEPRAIYYRHINKFDQMKVLIAVPIQQMVESDVAGIMFTADPVTNDESKVVIEAGWGLGEAVVSGSVTPDRYVVDKASGQIMMRELHRQTWKITRRKSGGGNSHVAVPAAEQQIQKLPDDLITKLARLGSQVEAHYGKPQDLEWAMEDGRLYLVQSRPITTLGNQKTEDGRQKTEKVSPSSVLRPPSSEPTAGITEKHEVILKGAPASIGQASGPVKIIHSPKAIDQVQEGDVLVTEMTTPDYVPAMRRAVAIVTDTGGRTCHAAIVSRELGIPCVVGTGTATTTLKTGQVVTVDGAEGVVYKGAVASSKEQVANKDNATSQNAARRALVTEAIPITGTKVYVNLGEPELAGAVAKAPADGVGLMRAEFIIAGIGEHPRAMLEAGRGKEFSKALADGMATIAQAFHPRPVIYRATDFKTNEYRNLKGGAKFEPQEANPMLGYRGVARYIKEPDLFQLEIDAIRDVREKEKLTNLHLMLPMVRTVEEFVAVRTLLEHGGLQQSNDFKLWIMVEVPSTVILIERFCQLGIDGVSIGSNDLTQFTLGLDRDSSLVADIFDERNVAVMASMVHVVNACKQYGVTSSICGQAASTYPEIVEGLVRAGITSVSVSPDAVASTKKLVASVEKRLMLEHAGDHMLKDEYRIKLSA